MFYIVFIALAFMLGSWHRDHVIKNAIIKACRRSIGDDTFLVGDTIDHIKSMGILTHDEIMDVLSEL